MVTPRKKPYTAPVLTREEIVVGVEQRNLQQIEQAAKRWWTAQRPEGWTEDEHLDNPTVNCKNKTTRDLAVAVANWRKLGG